MKLINFSNCKDSHRYYGGDEGRKAGVIYNGERYMLKFPSKTREPFVLPEYIGSHIYSLLGIPTQETLLGTYGDYNVVACKDFAINDYELAEFRTAISTFNVYSIEDKKLRSEMKAMLGNSTNLEGCLKVIKTNPLLEGIQNDAIVRFWDMFVTDAFIGNGDRNNSNWGFLYITGLSPLMLAPVYDNGHSFRDEKSCFYTELNPATNKEEKIDPYKYIASTENSNCNDAVLRFVKRYEAIKDNIVKLIEELDVVSEVQRHFYLHFLNDNYNNLLLPTFKKIIKK